MRLLSPRTDRLRARFERDYSALGRRRYVVPAEAQAFADAIRRAYLATEGQPPILRRARVLTEFAASALVESHPDDLLAGSQRFADLGAAIGVADLWDLGYAHTSGHIIHDYEGLLQRGVSGYREEIAAALARADTPEARTNLTAFAEALEAFAHFISRHGAAAADLLAGPPATFARALQLVWFAQVFLHAENPCAAISLGRMDQYLWPFLREDLAAGRATLEDAFELLCAFCLRCCEGEESQNAVLGGVDAQGQDATNPASLLLLEAVRSLRAFQPSLTVRVHAGSDPAFLAAAGAGQPGFMNDAAIIPALQAVGVPLDRARDWAVVGCYEATPPGDSYPNTVLGQFRLAETLPTYLADPRAQAAENFPAFLEGWFDHARAAYGLVLADCQRRWNEMRDRAPSPFGSVLMRGCLERALPLEAGAAPYNFVGMNILGLGTVVDSLHVVREVVFGPRALTVAELADAVAADFPDESLRARLLRLPGRYGTDSAPTNELAREVSARLARMVLDSRLEGGVRPYPGFFAFSADIYALGTASPDGRHASDLLSYGVAPSASVECPATSLLRSAACVAHELCACGNPLALTLAPEDLSGPRGAELIRELVEAYFSLGGCHLHFNLATAEQMREAQAHPERWASLTVRVSGYSARFVAVEPRWQEALIARAAQGR